MAWTDMTDLTGLVVWHKPESLASSYSNGDSITTWADSSGNSRDLTGSSTTRPLALANAVGTYMAADFDGTDDFLVTGSYTLPAGQLTTTMVVSLDVLKNFNSLLNIDDTAVPSYVASFLHCYVFTSGELRLGFNYNNSNNMFDTSGGVGGVVATQYHIISYSNSLDAAYVRIDGNLWYQFGRDQNQPGGNAYNSLGRSGAGGGALNGKVAEIIVSQPADSDHSAVIWVEGYLADKYGITLADGHLFKNAAPENAPTTYNATGGGSSYTNVASAKFTRLE